MTGQQGGEKSMLGAGGFGSVDKERERFRLAPRIGKVCSWIIIKLDFARIVIL